MADMNVNEAQIDALAARLRASEPDFNDGQFTDAVMAALPSPTRMPAWQKNAILLTATTIGSALAALQVPQAIVAELIIMATSDWTLLMGVGAVITYTSAAAAAWTAKTF